jgi:hypothetical protein
MSGQLIWRIGLLLMVLWTIPWLIISASADLAPGDHIQVGGILLVGDAILLVSAAGLASLRGWPRRF